MDLSRGNPFSTRYTQPGALEYLFPKGEDAAQLVARLRAQGWWGQVIGPHGAGKTTLLKTLHPLLQQAGRRTRWVTLRGGQRQLPDSLNRAWRHRDSDDLIIVDGYEQLGCFRRWQLRRRCRAAGAGLLVTSHSDTGLPTLARVQPSVAMLQALVHQLLREQPGVITDREVAERFEACEGNMRESLFALYDLYELRRREP